MNKRQHWVVVFLWLSCSVAQALDGTLLVTNRSGGSISFFDLATLTEIARVPIGPTIPHEVAVSPDGRQAITAEYGVGQNHGRHVILIDIASARVTGRIDLGPNSRPHTVLFMPDGRHAVATMQDSDQIAFIDLETMKMIRTYPTGGREGHMMRLSPDGSRAYVTSRGAEGTLSVVFLNEDRDPVVLQTGLGAEGLEVTPDGKEIWVADRQEESVSIIDSESLQVVERFKARPYAGRIAMASGGRAVMPNGGGGGEPVPQYLRLLDRATREMVAEVPLRDGEPQYGNFGILVHDGWAFVSDPYAGTIQMFNLGTLLNDEPEREFISSDHDTPDGMAWSPIRVGVMGDE
ncbi:MAG: YncE family protein [Arenicellaceae bacterium]|nr:YncE family protein [Arenicellaceae bacterium]